MTDVNETTSETPHYAVYWKAWAGLLIITLAMLKLDSPTIVVLGITIKAFLILLVFMHLLREHKDIAITVGVGIFATVFVMFAVMGFDARGW
ncbi:MAG: hypothetical protein CMJ83_07230 [Planctomycetes bacterium]|nr:hypothetical protein [Planctomycetota bacterium]